MANKRTHTHMHKRVVFRMNYTQTHSRIHSKLCVTIIVCIQQLIRIKSFSLRQRLFLGSCGIPIGKGFSWIKLLFS